MGKIILALIFGLALTLGACGKKDSEKPAPQAAKQEEAAVKAKETLPTAVEMADKVEQARQEEKAVEKEAAAEEKK